MRVQRDAGYILSKRVGANILQSGGRCADKDDAAFNGGPHLGRDAAGCKYILGGDISFRSVGADIEPKLARRGHRNDEVADFDLGDGVRHVGRAGQHIGRRALRDPQRFNRKVGIELFAVAQEKRDSAHDRRRVARIEADMPDARGIGLELRPQWCRRLDMGRRASRDFRL